MSTLFGPSFYDYHLAFSARAATLLLNYNIKLDWSKRDNHIFSTVFAGRRALSCTLCQSSSHVSDFCPIQSFRQENLPFPVNSPRNLPKKSSSVDAQGRQRITYYAQEVCKNFNSAPGCSRSTCNLLHACLLCKSTFHGSNSCPNSQKPESNLRLQNAGTQHSAPKKK